MAAPNQMKFFQRGRGVIFNPKIYVADFGNFTQGFLIQNSNFRVQGILTPTPQNGPHLWKSCACISYYCPCTSLHILNHNHYKKFALYVIFQKWGGGIEGRFEFFRKFIRFGGVILRLCILLHPGSEEWNTRGNVVTNFYLLFFHLFSFFVLIHLLFDGEKIMFYCLTDRFTRAN